MKTDQNFRAWEIVRDLAEADAPTHVCDYCGLLLRSEAWWREAWEVSRRVLNDDVDDRVVFVDRVGHEAACLRARARLLVAEAAVEAAARRITT